MEQPSSNLFEGYRSLGHVTGPLPFLIRHGKNIQDTRIVTIVGNTFHTYAMNANLVEVSIPHEQDIQAIIADSKYIYSASGRSILVWGRGSKKLINRLDRGHQADICILTKFGNSRIISVDEDNVLFNWNLNDREIVNIISFDKSSFDISSVCHPINYADKILIGSKQGSLQLWNIVKEECLYKFFGWNSGVTCLVQSPVEGVVGIGLEDGHIHIHNIKYDKSIMKMQQDYGRVTSMAFRLDNMPYLVSASEVGHLSIWNLERKRLSTQIRSAHAGNISCCKFVRNECLLVTTGYDNSIKIWSMDMSDGGGNLLSQRAGHREHPTFIRFYGEKGFQLLSAGMDSTMKCFHLLSERLNRNLGTARLDPKIRRSHKDEDKKLPPITYFASESAREKHWDNIAACHQNSNLVSTWNLDKCRIGDHLIEQSTFGKHEVHSTRTCISGCGNFVVIGFSNGFIFKYNIQSGIFRLTFESPDSADHKAHSESVTGLCIDSLGLKLISASSDSEIKLWNFKTGALNKKISLESSITQLELHRENNLLAVATKKSFIHIIDLDTNSFVRRFQGRSEILDMTFSPDARWLIAAYNDKAIRTWDLALGKLIDAFALSKPCVSLSMSSTGEFLATAHAGSLGINVWSNFTLYVPTPLRTLDILTNPPVLDMPFVRCDEKAEDDDEESNDQAIEGIGQEVAPEYISPENLHKDLIELSGLPSSRWKNLLHVDEIRERQRIEGERRSADPVKVPFFIPIKEGLKPKLDKSGLYSLDSDKESTKETKIQELRLLSPLGQTLLICGQSGDYREFLSNLKELGPSATDVEIRSLGKDTCGSSKPLICFLDAIKEHLSNNLDFELASSWLALCLKLHFDDIESEPCLQEKCIQLKEVVDSRWGRLKNKFDQIFCVMNFIRAAIL